jgi:hypothetical protein
VFPWLLHHAEFLVSQYPGDADHLHSPYSVSAGVSQKQSPRQRLLFYFIKEPSPRNVGRENEEGKKEDKMRHIRQE